MAMNAEEPLNEHQQKQVQELAEFLKLIREGTHSHAMDVKLQKEFEEKWNELASSIGPSFRNHFREEVKKVFDVNKPPPDPPEQ
jgi:hypothetical protein